MFLVLYQFMVSLVVFFKLPWQRVSFAADNGYNIRPNGYFELLTNSPSI